MYSTVSLHEISSFNCSKLINASSNSLRTQYFGALRVLSNRGWLETASAAYGPEALARRTNKMLFLRIYLCEKAKCVENRRLWRSMESLAFRKAKFEIIGAERIIKYRDKSIDIDECALRRR